MVPPPLSDWVLPSLTESSFATQPLFGSPYPLVAQPESAALWVLLGAVWLAMGGHLLRIVILEHESRKDAAQPGDGREVPSTLERPTDQVILSAALVAAAIWPWLADASSVMGLLGAAVMAVLAILAALGDTRHRRAHPPRNSVGLFAGWAVVALYASFAGLVVGDLGLSSALAIIVSVLLLLATAIEVQLRLGPRVGFSLAIICAMIGFASQSLGVDLTATLVAIVAITAIATVMVRVLS